jgi:hypothetical protein
MPSPFPGMDPWLEAPGLFPIVHGKLIDRIADAINLVLPKPYLATTDRLVEVDPESRRKPDVSTFGPDERADGFVSGELFVAAGMVGVLVDRVLEPWEQPYLEIVSEDGDRLVTALEVLSPANKAAGNAGRTAYQQKHEEFRLGHVNVIEIDLLRGGTHTTAAPLGQLRRVLPGFDYHICTSVISRPLHHFIKPFRMTDPLPPLVVPLDPGVPPVRIELQPLFDNLYDIGQFARLAKYATRRPDPPLTLEQQAWAEGLLAKR